MLCVLHILCVLHTHTHISSLRTHTFLVYSFTVNRGPHCKSWPDIRDHRTNNRHTKPERGAD